MLSIAKNKKIIICGVGFQTETLIKYFKKQNKDVVCVLVNHFTQKPEDCYLIPSKRHGLRNSFSEVDMLMDNDIDGIHVKRFDMLTEEDVCSAFLVAPTKESRSVFENISNKEKLDLVFLSEDDLRKVNEQVWGTDELVKMLWNTNQYLFSEMEVLKNSMRRQLQSTTYDFHFEFHLVEHCNLKCAGCTHFSPLAEEEFLSVDEFEKDMKRLSQLTNKVARFINLLGGEPLLHPEISRFLDISRKYFPDTIIRVVTNGVKLMDMDEEFWQSCKRNDIVIGVTQYPIDIDYEVRLKLVSDKGIAFESFSGGTYPRDEMWKLSLDEKGKQRPVENFMRCPRANACIFISHGKVFNCATMANIDHFNKCFNKDFKLSEDDYVDIYKVNHIQEILSFLCNPKPFCRYCNIDDRKYGQRWQHSRKTIDEWT